MPDVRDRMLQVWLPVASRGSADEPLSPFVPPAPCPVIDSAHEPDPDHATRPPDPLDNRPWVKLVEDCIDLFDELDAQLQHLEPAGRDLAEHVCLRLQEILQRGDVELIDQDGTFERTLHQAGGVSSAGLAGAPVQIVSPGFRVGRRILRRARVQPIDTGPVGAAGTLHDGDADDRG